MLRFGQVAVTKALKSTLSDMIKSTNGAIELTVELDLAGYQKYTDVQIGGPKRQASIRKILPGGAVFTGDDDGSGDEATPAVDDGNPDMYFYNLDSTVFSPKHSPVKHVPHCIECRSPAPSTQCPAFRLTHGLENAGNCTGTANHKTQKWLGVPLQATTLTSDLLG